MATSLTYDTTSGGFNPATFKVDPADHLFCAGMTVVNGLVVNASWASTKYLFETSGALPSGVAPLPSGVGTLSGAFTASNYDTLFAPNWA